MKKKPKESPVAHEHDLSSDHTVAGRFETVKLKIPQEQLVEKGSWKRKIILGLITAGLIFMSYSWLTEDETLEAASESKIQNPTEKALDQEVVKEQSKDNFDDADIVESLDDLDKPIPKVKVKRKPTPAPVKTKEAFTGKIDYLSSGGGLVYNCRGRHWACVSSRVYENCDKSNGRCMIKRKFDSIKSCQRDQLLSINANRKPGC